jgi:hypothetical protein
MNSSDPVWYEALQGNPLRTQTFTEQLKTRISTNAQSVTTQRRTGLSRFAIISLAFSCVIGFLIFAAQSSELFGVKGNPDQLTQPFVGSEWQKLIDERYPEANNEVMFTHKNKEGNTVVFYRKM